MAVKIVTDSGSDITPEEAKELGITVVPLTVNFDGKEYADGVEISHREFFEKLVENDVLPTTSQVTPAAFEECFKTLTANGDEVVAILISSKLSGTYQSATIAAEDFEGKVFLADTYNVTVGERVLVLEAIKLAEQGMSAEQIAKEVEQRRDKVRVLAMLDTLEYLKKGGRISAAVAFAGGLLGIKPVIAVKNGEVELVGKARGSKNGNNLLRKLVDEVGGVDFSRPYSLVYSGLSDVLLKKYVEDSSDLWQHEVDELPVASIGSVIGTHVGPGAVGVAFFAKG